jgi:elongation factor 2
MMEKLWGDNYYNAAEKKWTKDEFYGEKTLERGFCQFIMSPIIKMSRAIMEGNAEQTEKMLKSIGVQVKQEEQDLVGKHLLKVVMSRWLNAADIIIEMMVLHLPSPR